MTPSTRDGNYVKRALASHSWVGLFAGAFMYLICLSGTLAVLFQEFERWEQPQIEEYRHYDIDVVDAAFRTFVAQHPEQTEHFHLVFPDTGIPRVVVENDDIAQFVNRDGSLADIESSPWTKMMLDLHLYLHLPQTVGLILVSVFGVMLCSLIISGVVTHKRIFRDAFKFRAGGNRQLTQTDLHNRLSVWGLPFHLMIGITGAYFGLASIIIVVAASAYHGGDRDAVVAQAFGSEPELDAEVIVPNVGAALHNFADIAPADSKPIFLSIHDARTPQQFIEIYATEPGRLVYSENYRFDAQGNFLNVDGVSTGEPGRQIIYSTYRLHFGHFGGFAVKVIYVILGLALSIISVTGINIWLEKRKQYDAINDVWCGLVWGAPLGLVVAALLQFTFGGGATAALWLSILAACGYAMIRKRPLATNRELILAVAGAILLLILVYTLRFGGSAFAPIALGINGVLLLTAAALTGYALYGTKAQSDQPTPE